MDERHTGTRIEETGTQRSRRRFIPSRDRLSTLLVAHLGSRVSGRVTRQLFTIERVSTVGQTF